MSWFNRRAHDPPLTPMVLGGSELLPVVGESFHQEALQAIVGSTARTQLQTVAILHPDPDNEYDNNAIAVQINDRIVGHLSRADAVAFHPGLDRLRIEHGQEIALHASIFGGGDRPDGGVAFFGVSLNYNPADFGIEQPPAPGRLRGTRTGLNNAIDTDLADDSYDLQWINPLPEDRQERVSHIRKLLAAEADAISRHYLFATCESDLYALRDSSPGILLEYDIVAEQHDREMEVIRTALIGKFGGLPLLQTYKQSSIRHAKAGVLSKALWWADRGLDLYATDSLNPGWPDDLRKRRQRLRTQIDREAK